jgi:hypothetical protein
VGEEGDGVGELTRVKSQLPTSKIPQSAADRNPAFESLDSSGRRKSARELTPHTTLHSGVSLNTDRQAVPRSVSEVCTGVRVAIR